MGSAYGSWRSTTSTATSCRPRAASRSRTRPSPARRSPCRPAARRRWRHWSPSSAREHPNTIFVAAGDLIGASPLLSGHPARRADHREPVADGPGGQCGRQPRVRRRHAELLRLQHGGCPPGNDNCGEAEHFKGAGFQYLAASTIDDATGKPVLPPYYVKAVRRHPGRVHRPDPEGHARHRDALGRGRPDLQGRGRDRERAGAGAARQGHRGDRGADPRGRLSDRRHERVPRHLRADHRDRAEARPGRGPRDQRPHAQGLYLRDRRPAGHQRRQVRHAGDRDRLDPRPRQPRRHAPRGPRTSSSAPRSSRRTRSRPR